jgi:pimeloyl-ACP methyl ester carboxylesterase
MRAGIGDGFYMVHFQQPGRADAELDRDRAATFRRVLTSASGTGTAGPGPAGLPIVPPGGGFLDSCPEPASLPAWLSERDIDAYAAQYAEAGFTGPLNWYRNLDRNWELTAAWRHAPVLVPALYVAGEQDLVVRFPGAREGIGQLASAAPRLREPVLLPGCGHWTQQERPTEVSAAMIGFIRELG